MQEECSTGIYICLKEGESSEEEKAFLEAYARREGLSLTEVYIEEADQEERVAFTRLLEDVRHGRISCIVVKNLEAFGKDPLETGYYLETVFPLLNVRFLAVEDDFDSSRAEDLENLEFWLEDLVSSLASKEFSRRQELFREMCRESGRVMRNNNAYGYQFDEESGRLKIDARTEPYVRLLFAWALSGVNRNEIAARLELLDAPTPGECANQRKEAVWSGSLLQKILYNPIYAGFHVMGKRKVSLCRGIEQHETDREEWLYFPDYHEPYITMEEYEQLQEMMDQNKKIRSKGAQKRAKLPDLFPEKVICGDCDRKMMFLRGKHQQSEEASFGYYRCRSRKAEGSCSNRHVQGNLLEMVVLERFREHVASLYGEKLLEAERFREFSPEVIRNLVKEIRVYQNGERIEVMFEGVDFD